VVQFENSGGSILSCVIPKARVFSSAPRDLPQHTLARVKLHHYQKKPELVRVQSLCYIWEAEHGLPEPNPRSAEGLIPRWFRTSSQTG
jgi:hypothetical protein